MKDLMKFENKQVRFHWDAEEEKWSVLKTRLKKEGSELATNCSQQGYSDDKKGNRTLAVETFVHKPFYAFNH